jgi:hypothetical protein
VHVDGVDQTRRTASPRDCSPPSKGGLAESDPLRIDTIYDPERARLKVILNGGVATTASLLKFVNAYLEA